MSLHINAFGRLTDFTINKAGENCPFGEASEYMLTFSKTIGQYSLADYPHVELLTYNVTDSKAGETVLNNDLEEYLIKICNFVNSNVSAKLFNNTTNSVKSLLLNFVGNEFTLTRIGAMVSHDGYYCPSYLEFKHNSTIISTVKLWFGQDAFIQQYMETELHVIVGMDKLDDVFSDPSNVKKLLAQVNPTSMNKLEQAEIGTRPPTAVVSMKYMVYDADKNPLDYIYNSIIIYGAYGNNPDTIRDTLVDYYLKNSSYGEDQWAVRIPDLFVKTEFVIIPLWDKIAISNNGVNGAIYRSAIKVKDGISAVTKYMPTFNVNHINNYTVLSPTNYKSIMLASIGHPDNRHKIYALDEQWPEYANIKNTSEDYHRYDEGTKAFLDHLWNMLELASDIDSVVSMEGKWKAYSRVTRENNLYIATVINNIEYLVLTKKSMLGSTIE